MSNLYSSTRNGMLQCFVCSPIPKVSEKNGQPVRVSLEKKLLVTELVLQQLTLVQVHTMFFPQFVSHANDSKTYWSSEIPRRDKIFSTTSGELRGLICFQLFVSETNRSRKDFKRQPGFDPITFTLSENSNYCQESLLEVFLAKHCWVLSTNF